MYTYIRGVYFNLVHVHNYIRVYFFHINFLDFVQFARLMHLREGNISNIGGFLPFERRDYAEAEYWVCDPSNGAISYKLQ